jgi:hypothetical protein
MFCTRGFSFASFKIYLSRRHTGERLDDIGEHFGVGGSGVCKIWRQMSDEDELHRR